MPAKTVEELLWQLKRVYNINPDSEMTCEQIMAAGGYVYPPKFSTQLDAVAARYLAAYVDSLQDGKRLVENNSQHQTSCIAI